ncbi:MAG: hypothetical protein U1F15_06540 [Burkholderiales bacterium]
MTFREIIGAAVLALPLLCSAAPAHAAKPPPAVPAEYRVDAWPRTIKLAGADVRVYPPQVAKWADSDIEFRSAVALKPAGAANDVFGVVFATARTHVDKVTRTVDFDDLKITRTDFPALPDRGAPYAAELAGKLPAGVRRVSLDRLQLSLATAGAAAAGVAVRNDPPRVIVSETPALLVPIDGPPVLKPVTGSPGFQRVINTRALILKAPSAPQYFLHVYDGWMMANSLDGPWSQPFLPPAGLDAVAAKVAGAGVVDMIDGGPKANPPLSLANGIPAIYTSQVPAELIVFAGKPDFVPVVGTGLSWASNTPSDVLRDASGTYFALLAGRWFRAAALTGPWTFVASDALPADFAKIPPTSRAGAVLSAVAGTQQAREAVIESMIPQTATIPLANGPQFAAKFDGPPQFVAIPGTTLSYAANAAVPIVQVGAGAYYAAAAGVWFTATSASGPWSIATSVPAAIYAIPPSSPIYAVTYLRIYGASDKAVFAGYTPGYLGALRTGTGTVVYGTGYAYAPWIGNAWYPAPATYGVAAAPVYNRYVGHTYGFAMGLAPVSAQPSTAGGAQFHPLYWGGYPCCGTTSANVYRYWGRAAYAKSLAKKGGANAPKVRTAAKPAAPPPAAALPMTNANAIAPPPLPPAGPNDVSAPSRGYDMTMVTSQDAPPAGRSPASAPSSAPQYISAVEYYKSIGRSPPKATDAPPADLYADANGNVYRHDGAAWQQHAAGAWTNAPAPPIGGDQERQARDRATQAGMQAGSYSMSNTTRFSGMPGDGWSRRDSGDGGYSRTLGGDGGISAERWAYNDAVMNNAFDIAMNGGWWGDGVYIGGIGWGGAFGPP